MENKYLKLAELVATSNGDMTVNSGVEMKGEVDTSRKKNMDNIHPPRDNGDLSLNKMQMGSVPEHKIEGSLPASGNGVPSKSVEGSLPAKKAEAEEGTEKELDMELVKIAAALGNKHAISILEPEQKEEKTAAEAPSNSHVEAVTNIVKLAEAGVVEAQEYMVKTEALMPGLLESLVK